MYICHIDDIHSYLVALTTITNGVAILDHEFMELEVLKSIFTVIVLIRFHLTRLFHTSLVDDTTVYSTLFEAFPTLHQEMLTIHSSENQVFKNQVFKNNQKPSI